MANLTSPVDFRSITKPVSYNDYARAEQEFQERKAMAIQDALMKKRQMELDARAMQNRMNSEARAHEEKMREAQMPDFKVVGNQVVKIDKRSGDIAPVYSAPAKGMMVDPDTGEVVMTAPQKPLPVGALNLQDEITQSIAGTGNIASDAYSMANKIRAGQVPLQPTGKIEALLRNKLGFSDEQSRNYGAYNTFIEKLRNDTLRLNKGVQTEGDAQRALNELVSAGNDTKLAAEAMQKIADINNRALGLQKERLKNLRANYNKPELDLTEVTGVSLANSAKPSIPDGATATNPQTGQKIKRINGQWVPIK